MGNNSIAANASGNVVQSTQYYPFGMAFAESSNQGTQLYKYNDKELDLDHGLNWYDYEARYLTNDVPRFTTMDPLAEKYYSISPYAYVTNNPMRLIDPDERSYTDYVDKNGIRQVKTNDATPDRIETTLPEVEVVRSFKVVAVGVSTSVEAQTGGSVSGTPVNIVSIQEGYHRGEKTTLGSSNYGVGRIDISGSYNIISVAKPYKR